MRVINITVEELENPGCNNGNYPEYTVTFDTGENLSGITCRCGNGCSGTDRLPKVGQEFTSWNDFQEYTET